jgi:ATP adenylyltransferase
MSNKYVFPFSKTEYIHGEKPDVECIICATVNKDKEVPNLEICRNGSAAASVNLYPYNSGHIMVYPLRHIEDLRELTEAEVKDIHVLSNQLLDVLDKLYSPSGYNIGYNHGDNSGASIKHLHQHIIPRFPNELGVIDLIGGAKVIIENPNTTLEKIKKLYNSKFS